MQRVHKVDGQGFGPGGESSGLVDVRAGDPIFDKAGKQLSDVTELRDTYKVYHVTDLNISNMRTRTAPNSSERGVEAQNQEFRAGCEDRGEKPRDPDEGERAAMIVSKEAGNVLDQLEQLHGVQVREDVDKISEAQFRVTSKGPVIEIPKLEQFENVHHQATSVANAASHAHLYTAAKGRADLAAEHGDVDEPAQARVAMYEGRVNTRTANNEEWAKAELAATYATINKVTSMPATYVPPPSTQDEAYQGKWADRLESPGGMAEVSRDVTTVEQGFSDDRAQMRQLARAQACEDRLQQQARDDAGVPGEGDLKPGGDPSVTPPQARPAAAPAEPAQTQQQDRAGQTH